MYLDCFLLLRCLVKNLKTKNFPFRLKSIVLGNLVVFQHVYSTEGTGHRKREEFTHWCKLFRASQMKYTGPEHVSFLKCFCHISYLKPFSVFFSDFLLMWYIFYKSKNQRERKREYVYVCVCVFCPKS